VLGAVALLAFMLVPLSITYAQHSHEGHVHEGHTHENGVRCYAEQHFQYQAQQDPSLLVKRQEMETMIKRYLENNKGRNANARVNDLIIPVVFHVVWNTAADNISDTRIQNQLTRLNEDFNKENADASGVPAIFTGRHADAKIRFVLAARDPNCNPTTGITRTFTNVTAFNANTNNIKSSATGGVDPWPVDDYLNIWVGDLLGGVLGYAQFPNGNPLTDGVVVAPFTVNTNANGQYEFGRTLVHEMGHYFNLRHIWGDGNCSVDDFVTDTPVSGQPHFGCPASGTNTCSGGDPDMFMNYMDYVDDVCMIMFTTGQVERMDAAIYTSRASLLSSQGHVPPPGPAADLWMADSPEDVGNEPNNESIRTWTSEDIWVRNTNDGFTNQEHQNPEYRTAGGPPNYVYVRVRNRGCGSAETGTVKAYWGKAHASWSNWPAPWDGTFLAAYPGLVLGGQIGAGQTVTLNAGDETILEFPWFPPNPADYVADFGGDAGHMCMIARIETTPTYPFGFTFPEGNNVGPNVRNNNNKIQKNVNVVDLLPGTQRVQAGTLVGNWNAEETVNAAIQLVIPRAQEVNLFEFAEIEFVLDDKLFAIWQEGGAKGENIKLGKDRNTIKVMGPGATLHNIKFGPEQLHTIKLAFNFQKEVAELRELGRVAIDLVQLEEGRAYGNKRPREGGTRFIVNFNPDERTIKQLQEQQEAQEVMVWQGRRDIEAGLNLQVVPNPFNGKTTISYVLPEAGAVELHVYNAMGRRVATLVSGNQTAGRHSAQFDGSQLPTGMYFYQLKAADVQLRGRMMLTE